MAKVTTVSKSVITRDWNDLEPKLLTFLATGVTASGLILIGNYLGLTITAPEASLGVVLISSIAGYLKKSSQTLPDPVPVKVVAPVAVPKPVVAVPVSTPAPPVSQPTSTVTATFTPPPVTPPTV